MTANGLRWAVCRRRTRPGAYVGDSRISATWTHTTRRAAEAVRDPSPWRA